MERSALKKGGEHYVLGSGTTAEEMGMFSWVKPQVSVEVAFNERTRFGVLRHAELVRVLLIGNCFCASNVLSARRVSQDS